eukprot:CAMPEP_0182452504 /NCGR_PEP_ID=MMETSP1172-20130603/44282_1 /TAXON_ID=708627 /ORGANISM="Timspurckia oligopyrenoides, Strain CCMP3278" /LENGTH=502 /DNA_ID=CAMNT_0024650339 /DNA_START=1182 /DNA_END=2687 /DNA_ORIENTATION=-
MENSKVWAEKAKQIFREHPVGMGTFNSFEDADKVALAVKEAVKLGYRIFDLAPAYGNQKEVGEALRECIRDGLVRREELFVMTKLWQTDHEVDRVPAALQETLTETGLDYIDCLIMHWPSAWKPGAYLADSSNGGRFAFELADVTINETWKAMEGLVEKGLSRTIAVSNFSLRLLRDLLASCSITPVANEIEMHPYLAQPKVLQYCQEHGIQVIAYSPLGKLGYRDPGTPSLLEEPVVQEIAQDLGKNASQVILKWNVQRNVVVIPKSLSKNRLELNADVMDWKLTENQMEMMKQCDQNFRLVRMHWWEFIDDYEDFTPLDYGMNKSKDVLKADVWQNSVKKIELNGKKEEIGSEMHADLIPLALEDWNVKQTELSKYSVKKVVHLISTGAWEPDSDALSVTGKKQSTAVYGRLLGLRHMFGEDANKLHVYADENASVETAQHALGLVVSSWDPALKKVVLDVEKEASVTKEMKEMLNRVEVEVQSTGSVGRNSSGTQLLQW